MKIATWNVNSLRVRLPHVLTWLNDVKPDVLALQEIKMIDADFPFAAFAEVGYNAVCSGQKTYNGVAVVSREKCTDLITDIPTLTDAQRRVLGITIGDVRILNVYIPNGESVTSEKYQYKLNWLKEFDLLLKDNIKRYQKVVVVGDFNIAPDAIDVHDPAQWDGKVLCSDPEREAFRAMITAGFQDCFRQLNCTEQAFTWWDYRMNAFKRNLGMRIDHILASAAFAADCVKCYVDPTPRGWERPSDHAPVIAEFSL